MGGGDGDFDDAVIRVRGVTGEIAPHRVVADVLLSDRTVFEGDEVDLEVQIDPREVGVLGSFSAVLKWSADVLEFVDVGESPISGFSSVRSNLTGAGEGSIRFNGFSVEGQKGIANVFFGRFRVVGAPGNSSPVSVTFSALSEAGTFEDLLPDLIVQPDLVDVVKVPPVLAKTSPSRTRTPQGEALTAAVTVEMVDTSYVLGSYSASLSWDPDVLQFVGVKGGSAGRFSVVQINQSDVSAGRLRFNSFNPEGAEGVVGLAQVTFETVGKPGAKTTLELGFTALTAAQSFADLLPHHRVREGRVFVLPPPATPSPDFNGDGAVDFGDFLGFAAQFGKKASDTRFDLDGDGEVGFPDFLQFAEAFGQTAPGARP